MSNRGTRRAGRPIGSHKKYGVDAKRISLRELKSVKYQVLPAI